MLTRQRAKRATCVPFINTPLDVFLEIFLYLEPLDLLYLARTTKGLREFLLNRQKSFALWKHAIASVKDFPPCPNHMSPPAYTHLAFVPVCHGCFCPCETVDWELRMRCCEDCFPEMTMLRSDAFGNKKYSYLYDLNLPRAYKRHILIDNCVNVGVSVYSQTFSPAFSLLDWEVAQSHKPPRNTLTAKIFAEQNVFWGSVRRHAHLCADWEYERLRVKATQLSSVRKQRVEDITGRLKDLGWGEVLSSHYHRNDFLQLPQAKKLEPLTPTEWAEIQPELISWAREASKVMRRNHGKQTLSSVSILIREELGRDTSLRVQPQEIDVAGLPAIQSLLESYTHSDASDDELKKKLFRMLPSMLRKWSLDAVEELEQLSRKQLSLPSLSKPSCLPSVVFRCKVCSRRSRCHKRMRFDQALSHYHLYETSQSLIDGMENLGAVFLRDELSMTYSSHPRNIHVLQVDVIVGGRVENLIKRMRQNSSKVTYEELCRSTVKVVCALCRPQVATRMDFEHAFDHCLIAHLTNNETEMWTRVSARE